MLQPRLSAALLVALVSLPGFLIGEKLRQGDTNVAMYLFPVALVVVFLASALMRQPTE